MAGSLFVVFLFTIFWGAIGIGIPIFLPKNENRGLIQTMVVTSAVCCYAIWLCTYMAQMNPLIGPQLDAATQLLIWNNWN